MRLIRYGNLIINVGQIIEAEFTPARSGVDEDSGKEFSITAKLQLRFTASESEPHTDYNGDYTGFATHSPYGRVLRDDEAESVWRKLERLIEE